MMWEFYSHAMAWELQCIGLEKVTIPKVSFGISGPHFGGCLDIFRLNLGILERIWDIFGPFFAEYDNFFTAFVSKIWINEPGAK